MREECTNFIGFLFRKTLLRRGFNQSEPGFTVPADVFDRARRVGHH